MYSVYILRSIKDDSYYIGYSSDFKNRLLAHNVGKIISIRRKAPFVVIHLESYATRGEAMKRESMIKSYKGGNAFKELIRE